jgi:hypothetical protein
MAIALIVAAILFFLLYRRRRTRNLESQLSNLHKDHSPRWEEEKRNLLIQLNEAQMERGQLRAHLQIADTQDRRDVVELFDKLNISIKNSCLLASKAVLKSAQLNSSWTTKDASDPKQLQKLLDGAGLLVVSARGAGRRLEDFLPLAFCYIVNSTLVNNLFGLFHPGLSIDENKLMLDMYSDVRRRGWLQICLIYRSKALTQFFQILRVSPLGGAVRHTPR